MSQETKDLIQKNIEARVETDFRGFKEELHLLLLKYLPFGVHAGSYYNISDGSNKYLTGEAAKVSTQFLKEIENPFRAHNKEKREKEFSEILTNLGSYLENMNR